MTMRIGHFPVSRRMLGRMAIGASMASFTPFPARAASAPAPRFSVMAWALGHDIPFERQLGIISQAGYQGIELTGEFRNWTKAETREAASRIRGHGLVVDAMAGVRTGFAKIGETAQFLTELSQVIESAVTLECGRVILVSGPVAPDMAPAEQQSRVAQALQKAAELAAAASIELVIEPIDRFENPTCFLTGARQAKAILQQVNKPNVKILFDIFHEQRAYGNVLETLELLIKDISLIHIADSPRRGAPGTGELNFRRVYSELGRLGYHDWIAMEFYPEGDPVPPLVTARHQAIEAMSRQPTLGTGA
ncbi:hydroxypyruvate isomerase [Novosphingobium sp. SG751A]|uniref:TIM barrel protein n=1 Tax=Novosphingobium sp. SG751A TaxID=2587000 RepID=UPI001551D7FE|nr:TIM barrel protein [Novosphingobium sp. SG751A]NOW45114.1 hydroxypyruvate isomerase [Novosphingobium sp. SG751A]